MIYSGNQRRRCFLCRFQWKNWIVRIKENPMTFSPYWRCIAGDGGGAARGGRGGEREGGGGDFLPLLISLLLHAILALDPINLECSFSATESVWKSIHVSFQESQDPKKILFALGWRWCGRWLFGKLKRGPQEFQPVTNRAQRLRYYVEESSRIPDKKKRNNEIK